MIKHILFDVDGTLLNSSAAFCGSLEDALARNNIPHGDISIYFTLPLKRFISDYTITDPNFLPDWNADYVSRIAAAPLFDGVNEMMDRFVSRGLQMGVVTSRLHEIALVGLAENGLGDAFGDIIAADDVTRPKPDAEPINLYLSRHSAQPDEVIYLGDALTDRQSALAAGVRFFAPAWAPLPPELAPDAIGQRALENLL